MERGICEGHVEERDSTAPFTCKSMPSDATQSYCLTPGCSLKQHTVLRCALFLCCTQQDGGRASPARPSRSLTLAVLESSSGSFSSPGHCCRMVSSISL